MMIVINSPIFQEKIMKKLNLWAVLLTFSFIITGCSSTNADSSYDKRYKIKAAMVEYSLSGSQTGAETLYFDDWGKREVRYTQTQISMMGFTQKTNRMGLLEGDWMTNIDLDRRTGTKMKNPMMDTVSNRYGKDLSAAGEDMLKKMGGRKTGTETIAGKLCDVWEVSDMGSKTWIWKGVPLKTQARMMGVEVTTTAVKVQEGGVPQDKFKIPSDITITEGQNLSEIMKKMKAKQY
jgi:hypothetical protein